MNTPRILLAILLWPVFAFAERAAEQVVAPDAYIEAVLGSGR